MSESGKGIRVMDWDLFLFWWKGDVELVGG